MTNYINTTNVASPIGSTPFGIGVVSPAGTLGISNATGIPTIATVCSNANSFRATSFNGNTSSLNFRSAESSEGGSSHTLSGTIIGQFNASGHTDTLNIFATGASINFTATQDFSDTAHGSSITFLTTPDNSNTSPAARMTVDQSGFVGIGSTTPSNLLTLAGSASTVTLFSDTASGTNAATFASYGANASSILTRSSVGTKASPTATVSGNSLGKFGGMGTIGAGSFATAPTGYMEVVATEATFASGTQGTRLDFYSTPTGSATPANRMTITASGLVGLGVTNPDANLQVRMVGSGATTYLSETDGQNFTQIDSYGNTGSIVYITSSPGTIGSRGATGSPTTQDLCLMDFRGYNGTTMQTGARMFVTTTEQWTGSARGTKLGFSTTANGTTSLTTRMTIDQSGFVGVGTTSPTNLLSVVSGAAGTSISTESNFSNSIDVVTYGTGLIPSVRAVCSRGVNGSPTAIQASDSLLSLESWGYGATGYGASYTGQIQYYATEAFTDSAKGTALKIKTTANGSTSALERMTIDQNGFVGIGTTIPLTLLHVSGTGGNKIMVDSYGGESGFVSRRTGGSLSSPAATPSGSFMNRISARGYYTNSGSAFTNDTASVLMVANQAFTNANNGTRMEFYTTTNNTSTQTMRMSITDNGDVGVGATLATHRFELLGSDDAAKTTTTTWTTTSDVRIKTDIQDVADALTTINAIKPRTYKYTEAHKDHMATLINERDVNPIDTTVTNYGFIADELEVVMPSCVKVTNDRSGEHENLKTVNPHNINILMVKAIQELSALVTSLTARIEALEAA